LTVNVISPSGTRAAVAFVDGDAGAGPIGRDVVTECRDGEGFGAGGATKLGGHAGPDPRSHGFVTGPEAKERVAQRAARTTPRWSTSFSDSTLQLRADFDELLSVLA
jgi:hypothetical protein